MINLRVRKLCKDDIGEQAEVAGKWGGERVRNNCKGFRRNDCDEVKTGIK